MRAAVVRARSDRDALAIGEPVHSILADLVSADHNLQLVHLEELLDEVCAKQRHVVLFKRVSEQVRMHTQDVIVRGRVTPEQFHCGLLGLVVDLAESDLEGSLYFFDVLYFLQGGTNTRMHTENLVVGTFIVDNGSERQILKHVVEFLEDRVGVVDVLTKTAGALLSQSQVAVHVAVLMVASQHEDLLGVLKLQRHQQTDHLKTLAAAVNVVTQEQIVEATDVA